MKLFQIYEEDLQTLEELLPQMMSHPSAWTLGNNRAFMAKYRRVQEIIKNVRWNYGPHKDVERVEPD